MAAKRNRKRGEKSEGLKKEDKQKVRAREKTGEKTNKQTERVWMGRESMGRGGEGRGTG